MNQGRRPHMRRIVVFTTLGLALVCLLAGIGAHLWLARMGAQPSSSVFNQPVAASTNQPISAQTLARLHPVWSYSLAPSWSSRTTVVDGVVYVLSTNASGSWLTAIRDGTMLWRSQIPNAASYPGGLCISGGGAYVRTPTSIYAVDAHNGASLWQFESVAALDDAVDTVACDGATVYAATRQQVQALDATTGKLLWSYEYTTDPTSAYSPFGPRLAADAGSLYLFLSTSPYVAEPAMTALEARHGSVRWQIEEKGAETGVYGVAPLVGANGVIYWLSGRNVVALAPTTGATLWNAAASTPEQAVASAVRLDADQLYVSGRGYLRVFDLNSGRLAWQTQLPGTATQTELAVSGGVVYVATATLLTGRHALFVPPPAPRFWLYAFDAASGRLVGKPQDNDTSFSSSFLAADATRLYALGLRTAGTAAPNGVDDAEVYALGV
jgi:outer membrane protein assembly factor BamB